MLLAPGLVLPDRFRFFEWPLVRLEGSGLFGFPGDMLLPRWLREPDASGGFAPGGDEFEGGVVAGDVVEEGGDVGEPEVDDDDGGAADGAAWGCAWDAAVARPNAPATRNVCNLSISEGLR